MDGVSSEEMRKYIECPKFWINVLIHNNSNIKKLEINEIRDEKDHVIEHETITEVEIDSLGLIKRTIHLKQRIRFIEEGERIENGIKINGIKIKIEKSNYVRVFDCYIKIEEKPGKARVTFNLNRMIFTNELLDLLSDRIATIRFKRGVRKALESIQEFIKNGTIRKFNEIC